MKINKKQILKYVDQGILKLINNIKYKPYIFISEADFQAQLYMTLYNSHKIFRQLVYDKECEVKTNILHTEVNYYEKIFKYDIGILDPNRFHEEIYLNEKPVMVGMELKCGEYASKKSVLDNIENDARAFKANCVNLYAEYGFVVYLNTHSDLSLSEIKIIKQKIHKIKIKRNLKKIKFYYIQINDDNSEPIIVKV